MDEPHRLGRRVGLAAAYTAGAVTALGTVAAGVILGEAWLARQIIPIAEAPAPRCDGDYGLEFGGDGLRLAVLGDSTAAGYGVTRREETPGALLATWIAQAAQRPVHLTCPALVGSISEWLDPQVETALAAGVPDLAVIIVGANDVTRFSRDDTPVRHLASAVRALRRAGSAVVVATCPDLGTVRPIRPPLRWLAQGWSRRFAAAQTVAAVREGARTVSLGDLLAPSFYAEPERMFGADHFHPSVEGYRVAASVVLPAALAALGLPATGLPATGADAANLAAVDLAAVDLAATAPAPAPAPRRPLLRRPVPRRPIPRRPVPLTTAAATAAQRPGTAVTDAGGGQAWVERPAPQAQPLRSESPGTAPAGTAAAGTEVGPA